MDISPTAERRISNVKLLLELLLAVMGVYLMMKGVSELWTNAALFVTLGFVLALIVTRFTPAIAKWLVRWWYLRRGLTLTQKRMIWSTGDNSSGVSLYNDVCEYWGIPNDGKARLQRLDLEAIGLMEYHEAMVSLTKLGDAYRETINEDDLGPSAYDVANPTSSPSS